ncbi:hypothetical protein [Microbacterium sp. W4I4]|uniref:hypothetical protein n=1 Tax=Microbacterium sp. W4I4 TaxID=3042295 RepID=UPI0027D85E74|nr:hypothetical protein [Microbacterium sp. W4I4]
MAAKTVRLTVADAHSRHDLVVPSDSTVAELLTVGGVDLTRFVGTTTSGAAIELDSEVSVTPGDGGVIWLFDRTAASAAETGPSQLASTARTTPVRGRWSMLSLLVAVAASMMLGAIITRSPVIIVVAAVSLLAGSVALLAHPVRDENTYIAFFAPLLAAGGGAVALSGFGDAGAMMAAGMVAGATVACIRHARAQVHGFYATGATAVIAALWAVFAVVNAAGFIAGVSAAALTALQLACAAPIFHYMRGGALDADADDLIDTPFVIRDALGIRAGTPREPAAIHADRAARQILRARRRSEAGTVMACVLAVLSAMHALQSARPGTVEGWCVLGGALGIGCYFLLTSRKVRDGLSRGAALIAGTLITVLSAIALVAALQVSPLIVALLLVVAGVIIGCMTVPLSRDWRSLGWSRTGDIVEALLLGLSPAALVYGSGIAGQILEVSL